MSPDIAAIETFLKVTGPWGLLGLFLFLYWDNRRRENRDDAKFYEQFVAFLERFTAHNNICMGCQQSLMLLVERVAQHARTIESLNEEIRREATKTTRGGRAGM